MSGCEISQCGPADTTRGRGAGRIAGVEIRRLELPLRVPYRLSYRTFESFEPFLVCIEDDRGERGFGEGHVSPGSSAETRAGGWAHLRSTASAAVGLPLAEAAALVEAGAAHSPVAASAVLTALEMLDEHPLLRVDAPVRLPILSPLNASTPAEIEREIGTRLDEGFRTFKVKVGKDVESDLERVRRVQAAVAGRATLRLDANRGFDARDGCRFASRLDPSGIELFEQPCASEDWAANAEVAKRSTVPLMLDEPICSVADVERAASLEGVGLCKVKLKRFGSVSRLDAVLARISEVGLRPVLGDGLACEPGCWMEACVARARIDNAGEFNGFLKPRSRLFSTPLGFEAGCVVLEPRRPQIDPEVLDAHTVERIVHGEIPGVTER